LRAQAKNKRFAEETRRHDALVAVLNTVGDELEARRITEQASAPGKESRETATLYSALIATLIALGTLVFTAYTSNTQHRDTLAALDKAAEANRISQENGWNQLRAYLGFNPTADGGMKLQCRSENKEKKIEDCNSKDSLGVAIKNFGSTPALHIKACSLLQGAASLQALDLKRAFDQVMNECDGHIVNIKTMWPSESAMFSVFFDEKSLASLQRSAKGDGVTILVSSITYTDEFNHHRRSSLCETLTGTVGAARDVIDCGGEAPEDF